MSKNKINPSLWFHTTKGEILEVITYYKTLFETDFESEIIRLIGQTPSGNTEMCEVKLFGQKYLMMSTEELHQPFNDAFALTINCQDQSEIDKYWDYFTRDGVAVQCGWCTDKYGVRWQVIPINMEELMSKPNAWQVMMGQEKIIIEHYLR